MLRERRRAVNNKPNRRLDRKSSRGMIYENEELRLRTININAEVERGQSDIRKLRRENDILRREIWALRDEYDRLDKLLTAHRSQNNSSIEDIDEAADSYDEDYDSNSDDNISCSTCQGIKIDDLEISENNKNTQKSINNNNNNGSTNSNNNNNSSSPSDKVTIKKEDLHVNFDHLSIVSEENSTNTSENNQNLAVLTSDSIDEMLSPNIIKVLSPLSELQSVQPSLHHFENLCYETIGPSIVISPLSELQSIQPSLHHFENLCYELIGPCIDQDGNILKLDEILKKPIIPPIPKPKIHFFSPLRINCSPDPIMKREPVYATINKSYYPRAQVPPSPSKFQKGGNLEDLLNDLSSNFEDENKTEDEIETYNPDIIAIESEVSMVTKTNDSPEPLSQSKRHRSEVSLVLNNYEKPLDNTKPIEKIVETPKILIVPTEIPEIKSDRIDTIAEECNNSSQIKLENPPEIQSEEKKQSPITDSKRKSRRVSLYFNNFKPEKTGGGAARRASIDVACASLLHNSQSTPLVKRRNSHHHNMHSNNHHHKSHESLKINGNAGTSSGGATTSNRRSSSRESSTSIATQKSRKISESSSSKIPWCACWGNGCF